MKRPQFRSLAGVIAHELGEALAKIAFPSENPQNPTSARHLGWMMGQVLMNDDPRHLATNNRWVGFVQGVMVANGMSSLTIERDRIIRARKTINDQDSETANSI